MTETDTPDPRQLTRAAARDYLRVEQDRHAMATNLGFPDRAAEHYARAVELSDALARGVRRVVVGRS